MRKSVFAMLVLVLSNLLASCSNIKQINHTTFVTAIGVDKSEKGVRVYALSAIPGRFGALSSSGGGGDKNPNYILQASGRDIGEALFEMKRKNSKDLNFGQCQIILFSEEISKQGLNPYLDVFMRREQFRITSWIAITKGSPDKVLQLQPKVTESSSDYLVNMFSQAGSDTYEVLPIYLYEFFSYASEPDKTPYAMYIIPDPKEAGLQQAELALFNEDKLVGKLTSRETAMLQMLQNRKLKPTTITTSKRSYQLLEQHTKTTFRSNKLFISTKMKAEITDASNQSHFSESQLKEAEEDLSDYMEKQLTSLLDSMQSMHVDPVGYGGKYRLYTKSSFERKTWLDNVFPKMPFTVKVTVELRQATRY